MLIVLNKLNLIYNTYKVYIFKLYILFFNLSDGDGKRGDIPTKTGVVHNAALYTL